MGCMMNPSRHTEPRSRRAPQLTSEEIARRAAEIRESWTVEERLRRTVVEPGYVNWTVYWSGDEED